MRTIFIVLGETGENDQQRSWLVKAFPTEQSALQFIDKLESTYQSISDENEEMDQETEDRLIEAMRDLDENFDFDSETGTEYSITECPFEDAGKPASRSPQRDRPFSGKGPAKNSGNRDRRPQRR